MKKIVLYPFVLLLFFVIEIHSQTSLQEINIGNEKSGILKEQISDFKKHLSSHLNWEVAQVGYISYNENKRYLKADKPGIEFITLKTVVMATESYQTCLKYDKTIIRESGKLYILKGVHRDILVLVDYGANGGGESLEINLYNQKLEKLCDYSESGEKLSEVGREIHRLIFEKPHKVIKWLSATKCRIESESVLLPTKEEIGNVKLFEDFQNLFEDISMYLGDMDSFIFPLDYDSFKKKILNAKPIPDKFKKYIQTGSSTFDFCRGHLNENRAYYPIYKIRNGKNFCLIMYYSVPEIPRNRVGGDYYFLFSYTDTGKLIEVYPLAFSGTDISCSDHIRYSKLWSLKDIKTVTATKIPKQFPLKEFVSEPVIGADGTVTKGLDKFHFEILPTEWVSAVEEKSNIYAVKECDSWVNTITFIIDDNLDFKVNHYTGQEATLYDVESLRTDSDSDEYKMILTDGSTRLHLAFSYYDPEHIAIEIKGLNDSDRKEGFLYVDKNKAVKDSFRIKKLPCEDGPR